MPKYLKINLSYCLLCCSFLNIVSPVSAQTMPPVSSPDAAQQRSIEIEQRIRQQQMTPPAKVDDPLDKDSIKTPTTPAVKGEGTRFFLKQIIFTPSVILNEPDLATLAADYKDREVSIADLKGLTTRINDLYKKKGVITAVAVIPPQEIKDGIVQIRLIEGRVGGVTIRDNPTTREDYVTRWLEQKPGDIVNITALEKDLIRFNQNNDAQMRAELEPGKIFGTTDLILKMIEPGRHSLAIYGGNGGSSSTGEYQSGAVYVNRSLLGFRDQLTLSAAGALGHQGASISYDVPFNTSGGRVSAGYYYDETQVKKGPFTSLNLTGESDAFILSARQPFYQNDHFRLQGVFGYKKRDSENFIDSIPLQQTTVTAWSAGADSTFIGQNRVIQGSVTYQQGDEEVTTSRSFSTLRGSASATQNLTNKLAFKANFNWQHTGDDVLPSSEQFFAGGDNSVRGYSTGLLSGDKGYTLNLELHHQLPSFGNEKTKPINKVSGFLFYDRGEVYPFRPPGSTLGPDRISSVGYGVNIAQDRWISVRAAVGFQIDSRPEEVRKYHVHLQIVSILF